jgi:hypothetical protein
MKRKKVRKKERKTKQLKIKRKFMKKISETNLIKNQQFAIFALPY